MLEARVHEQLRAFLRQQGAVSWPHHLTMARLVARALRLGRSSLMQVGSGAAFRGQYRLSYLISLLLWPDPVIVVLPTAILQRVQRVDIPSLQRWLPSTKPILQGDRWPDPQFRGILLTTPEAWLRDRLTTQDRFPSNIPVILDGADDLEAQIRSTLTSTLTAADWDALMQAYPAHQALIRDMRVKLTHAIFQHPANPYQCHLLDPDEQAPLSQLIAALTEDDPTACAMPLAWRSLWHPPTASEQQVWVTLNRSQGQWALHRAPIHVGATASQIWDQQPLVVIGGSLDTESDAIAYRQRLGLSDMTCVKFEPDRQTEGINLYVPDALPLPNTAEFQPALLQELARLLVQPIAQSGLTVIVVGDVPLKAQVGAVLASQFGSRVQVEAAVRDRGILICGWDYWRTHQAHLPTPPLLIIPTLPIPSLEDPLVAGHVSYYKRRRQDWFRLYLLPAALNELQRAIAPIRDQQGTVAILDTRVNHRSYGRQFLDALNPSARLRRLDAAWLDNSNPSLTFPQEHY